MLCFVCLSENYDIPNKAITYVQGTSVCHEHLNSVGSAITLTNKLREFAERLKNTQTIDGSAPE